MHTLEYRPYTGYIVCMKTTKNTATITTRQTPCNCGCKGTDPWHQRSYTRVISDRQIVNVDAGTVCSMPQRIAETGTARIPGRGIVKVERRELFHDGLQKWIGRSWDVQGI